MLTISPLSDWLSVSLSFLSYRDLSKLLLEK